jgi:hypothetical protein
MSNYQGHSIKPENYLLLKNMGSKNELVEMASKMPATSEFERKKPIPKKLTEDFNQEEYNTVFSLSFEMWLHYSIPAIADKGRELKDYTSWKLKDKALYLETVDRRYEIARNITDHTNDDYLFEEYETFRISEVKEPYNKDNQYMLEHSIPLLSNDVDVIFSRADWHEFQWGEKALKIRNLEINNLKCFNFYNIK